MQQLTRTQLMLLLFITSKHNGAQFDHMPNLLQDKSAVDALQKLKYVRCTYIGHPLTSKFDLIITSTKKGCDYINQLLLPEGQSK